MNMNQKPWRMAIMRGLHVRLTEPSGSFEGHGRVVVSRCVATRPTQFKFEICSRPLRGPQAAKRNIRCAEKGGDAYAAPDMPRWENCVGQTYTIRLSS